MTFPYSSPAALRTALTDRLKLVSKTSPYGLAELQRQFAYDRFLTRVFLSEDAGRWVLKGAVSLLARVEIARHSKDIDLAWESTDSLGMAEAALRSAVERELGDFFMFTLGTSRPLAELKGFRIPVGADLGGRRFAEFSVDVVTGLSMTTTPDRVPPLTPLEIPGLVKVDYQSYPVADHIADKVIACFEARIRDDGSISMSTRYKDLVDLVLFSRTGNLAAVVLRRALLSEAERRGMRLPPTFRVPSEAWVAGYEARAKEVLDLGDLATFAVALSRVKRLLDPVLSGIAHGGWDPSTAEWS